MIQNPDVLNKYMGKLVDPSYFTDEYLASISKVALHVLLVVKSGLSGPSLKEAVLAEFSSRKSAEWVNELLAEIDQLFSLKLNDAKFIEEEVKRFAQYASMRVAISEGATLIGDPTRYNEVQEKIREALKVGSPMSLGGHYLFKDAEKRMANRQIRNHYQNVLPTGFPSLDHVLMGGLAQGEEGIILAPTNRGKSALLMNLGTVGMIHKKRGLHITLELSAEKTSDRYDMRMAGLSRAALYADEGHDATVAQLQRGLMKHSRFGGEMYILFFPAHTLSVDQLRSQLEFISTVEGYTPDFMLVDYGDLMKCDRKYDERRHELSRIFEELRGLAGERKIPCWTATQGTRVALSKEIVEVSDIAEDIGKANIADVIVSICQTDNEYKEGKMRLFLAKARDSEAKKLVHCTFDRERMRIAEVHE